jgi:lysine-specific demethylase/histidyl-hydroxylase NO66
MEHLDFNYLIAPHTAADFFERYWQESALLIKRGEPSRHQTLLDTSGAANVAAILAIVNQLPAEAVDVIGRIKTSAADGESKAGKADNDSLLDWFANGATIRVKAIQLFCEPLGKLCRTLEEQLGFPVRANLYCTPANSRGFDLHFDTHEVLVLQLTGKKQWQVFAPTGRLPLEFVPPLPFETDREELKRARDAQAAGQTDIDESNLGPPVLQAQLEPGDCLYLPRGFWHRAEAQDYPSVHLTIGLHVLTWLDLFSVALGQVANRNEELRHALPLGLAGNVSNTAKLETEFNKRMQLFVRDALLPAAVNEIGASFARSRNTAGNEAAVESTTKLERNGVLRFYLAADGKMAGLACDQKEFWLPHGFAPALRFVAEQSVFSPEEIPGPTTNAAKLVFARQLLRDGFVRLAQK